MHNTTKVILLIVFPLLSACSNTPDVNINYYPTTTKVAVRAVRTILCDANNYPVIASNATISALHSADTATPLSINPHKLDSAFANSDFKIELREDGRSQGINSTGTGQGETIIKSAITLASAISLFNKAAPKYGDECKFIAKQGGGKPLTLTFTGQLDLNSRDPQTIVPDGDTEIYYQGVQRALGTIVACVSAPERPHAPVYINTDDASDVKLSMQQPAPVDITVRTGANPSCKSSVIAYGRILAAQLGVPYDLPIPKAPVFGKQSFAVAVEESGAISLLQYGKETSTGQAINVGNALATALKGETTAQQAADVKAEADLIAQQQRLVKCQADPTKCT